MKRAARPAEVVRMRDYAGRKYCIHCTQWLDEAAFRPSIPAPDGLAPTCRTCQNAAVRKWGQANRDKIDRSNVRRRYGLSPDEFETLVAEQGDGCAICGLDNAKSGFKRLVVDHDHSCCAGQKACGKCVRGLLCSTCNLAIGYMQDSPNLLVRAARYLEEWSSSKP